MVTKENNKMMNNIEQDVLLRLCDITKIYAGTLALNKVSLNIRKGEILGIIGKNGAGKSTLVGIMSGIINPTEGQIFFRDQVYKSISRTRAKNEGISIITQDPQIIPEYTVAENLICPDYIYSYGNIIDWRKIYSKAEEILDKNQININPYTKAGNLAVSEQQLLLVLKSCYVEHSQIIIFDEVSSSLIKSDQDILYRIIRLQKQLGKAILFISHRMKEILEICDRVTILRNGTVVVTEERSSLNETKLSNFIVGGSENYKLNQNEIHLIDNRKLDKDKTVLSVEKLTKIGVFQNINFELKIGEIVGLAGLRGSGRTEIFKSITGIDPADGGLVRLGEKHLQISCPSQALKSGIVYLPEDRDQEGLINILKIRENLTLSSLSRLINKIKFINSKKEKDMTTSLIDMLSILTPSTEEEVKKLSGGNKQKVLLGKVIASNPIVYLLDEPTKGIDISAKMDILKIIKEKLSKAAAIMLTSPGLEDLILICDRILILYKGEIIQEFDKKEFKESDLYFAIQGMKR